MNLASLVTTLIQKHMILIRMKHVALTLEQWCSKYQMLKLSDEI